MSTTVRMSFFSAKEAEADVPRSTRIRRTKVSKYVPFISFPDIPFLSVLLSYEKYSELTLK
jgi:hypothetical protein